MSSKRDDFTKKEAERVGRLYSTKHKKGFRTKQIFVDWYIEKIKEQGYKCYYCDTSIFDIEDLIAAGKLKTRKIRYGERGPKLEIDRKINENGYNKNNCVLSCYYCNNDKSYIIDSIDYKLNFGMNRNKYFSQLIKDMM